MRFHPSDEPYSRVKGTAAPSDPDERRLRNLMRLSVADNVDYEVFPGFRERKKAIQYREEMIATWQLRRKRSS